MKKAIPYLLLLTFAACATPPAPTPPPIDEAKSHRAEVAPPAPFVPKFDFAGNWVSPNSSNVATVQRRGKKVSAVYDTSAYHHSFKGKYVDAQTLTGIQIRKKLSDGSQTRMQLTITLTSPNNALVTWVALDSNSDLAKGQRGQDSVTRVE